MRCSQGGIEYIINITVAYSTAIIIGTGRGLSTKSADANAREGGGSGAGTMNITIGNGVFVVSCERGCIGTINEYDPCCRGYRGHRGCVLATYIAVGY